MEQNKILVINCDGSARPGNPGYGGYGLYGHTMRPSKRPSRIRHPASNKHFFTTKGILLEREKDPYETLDIIEYIGCIPGDSVTNNLAEIKAFTKALEIARVTEELVKVVILTDSNYVVSSFNEHMDKWINNSWSRADGKPISHKEEWIYIKTLSETLNTMGIEIEATWVKGHADIYGNEVADLYAVVGSNYARIQHGSDNYAEELLHSTLSCRDYRTELEEKDIILYYRDLFFSSDDIDDRTFCFLSTSEDETRLGKKDTASIFSVNHGYVPEVINKAKEIFRSIERPYIVNSCIKLNRLNENKHLYRLANKIGVDKLIVISEYNGAKQLMLVKDTSPFVMEYNKDFPYIVEAGKVFNSSLDIASMVESIPNTWVVDITDRVISEGKLLLSNREKLLDLGDMFEVPFNFVNKLILTLGKDIPAYNALKKLESEVVKVKAVVERKQGSNSVSLYSIIETDNRVICSTNILNKFLVSLSK